MLKNNDKKILKDPAESASDKADEVETIGSHEAWGEFLKTVKEEMMSKPKSKWVKFNLEYEGVVYLRRDKISYFKQSKSGAIIYYDGDEVYVSESPEEIMKELEE